MAYALGIKLTPISPSVSIGSTRAEYENVGDDDSILNVLSRRAGDVGRTGGEGMDQGVSQSA